jgi:hypothetical protein
MSNTGKTSSYIRKTNVKESLITNTGFKKTRFLHEATLNQTTINLTSLTAPSVAVNYAAPNPSELSQTNLLQWSSNFTLTSSLRGVLIQNISYVITGAQTIKLLFEAAENEIFEGVIDHSAKNGLTLVDATPIIATGTLAANQTDFNVGTPFKVGEYSSMRHGQVVVYLDGQLMYRNTGNSAPGAGVEGDYYEVHAGGGLGTLIRFNTPDLINDRLVSVLSVAALVERPNGSLMAVMESLQGQVDALVPTVAALAGEPESNYQGAPNNVDLKAFGDRVLTAEQTNNTQNSRLTALESSPKPYAVYEASAAQSVALPGNFNLFRYNVLIQDNANLYNTSTGTITFPTTGEYLIIASVSFSGTLTTAQGVRILLDNDMMYTYGNGTSQAYSVRGTVLRRFVAGSTLQVGFDAGVAGSSSTDTRLNRLYIAYLGPA